MHAIRFHPSASGRMCRRAKLKAANFEPSATSTATSVLAARTYVILCGALVEETIRECKNTSGTHQGRDGTWVERCQEWNWLCNTRRRGRSIGLRDIAAK